MQKLLIAVALVLTVVCAAPFSNGGFESNTCGVTSFCTYFGTEIPSWSVVSGSVDLVNNAYWQANDGSWSVDMAGDNDGTLTQSFDTTKGNEYHVSFALSGNPEGGPQTKTLNVGASGSPIQTYSYTVTYQHNPIGNMNYEQELYTFTAVSSSSAITFQSVGDQAWGPVVDTVSVASFTPAQVCNQFTFTNPGYFCGTNGSGFYQCMNGAWSALSSWQDCAAGTSCACDYGVECSNGGTESPCRISNK